MKEKREQRILPQPTEQDIARARQLVRDGLGEEFDIEYATLPRNVGDEGDGGVVGDTVVVTSESGTPAKTFADIYEQLGRVATQIANETTTTKVAIDVTPPDAIPRFLPEQGPKDTRTFEERVKTRVQGYVLLLRKYYDQLGNNPELQNDVWQLMDEIDAEFKEEQIRKHGLGRDFKDTRT